MRKYLMLMLCLYCISVRAQVAINSGGLSPHSSAMLDITSTNRGLLIPRMTTAQRIAIASPATGLMVYDSTSSSLWYYDGSNWGELNLWKSNGGNIFNSNAGNIGIGTSSPNDKLEINGNLRFTAANPTITASSYIIVPGGADFNNGTVWFQNTAYARGGLNNDQGTLNLSGSNGSVNAASGYFQVSGKHAIDGTDAWLRLNQQGSFANGIYTPGFLRADGGLVSGAIAGHGAGTIAAATSMHTPILYDQDNAGYYLDPASTTNLNNLRFNSIGCINGTCPPNGVVRLTPNLHFNAGSGYAVIVNWDNGTTGNSETFRVGNGAGSDAFY